MLSITEIAKIYANAKNYGDQCDLRKDIEN